MLESLDGLHPSAEDEDVFFTHFLINFDVGSIHSADDESSIHDELHIGSAGCLSACSGDVLAKF